MYLRELTEEIEAFFNAGLTVELVGSSGVGKSEWSAQLRDHLSKRDGFEWGLGIAFLGTYTPIDLLGYMIPAKRMVETSDGLKELLVSEFTLPPWLFSLEGRLLSSYRKAILLLDEYGQGEPDVKKTAADLRLNKRIGPHKLGKNVHIICASNRLQDRSGVTKSFDFEISRAARIEVEPEFTSWESWAVANNIPPIFILFARKHATEIVFKGEVPKVQGPWCTPRSFVAAVRFLMQRDELMKRQGRTHAGNFGIDDPDEAARIQMLLTGIIGEEASRTLCGFLRLRHETPDFSEVVADPNNCAVPSKIDAKMLTAYECAHFVSPKTMEAACTYLKRFPPEFHITFAKSAIKRNSMFVADDHMMKFIKGNTALMNAIA